MYGIYNTYAKEFQFGISEDTKAKAQKKLFKKIGKDSYKWRFEVRKINNSYKNNKKISDKKEKIIMLKPKRTETKVMTGKVRLSYANIFQPRGMEGQEPKFSVSLLIPKEDKETIKAIQEAIELARKNGIGKFGGKIPAKVKTTFYDGDAEKPDDEAYAGCYFLNASNKQKPGVVDAHRDPILDATEVYSGCYARAVINFYAYNASGSKGIAASLQHIQKISDGEPLGSMTRAEDEFDDIETTDEDFLG